MKTPLIEWQFIVMKHNQHEMAQARKIAADMGVDLLRFIPAGMPMEIKNRAEAARQWFPSEYNEKNEAVDHPILVEPSRPGPCFYLYRSIIINPDGGVSPCCNVYRKRWDFAALTGSEIHPLELWNNLSYISARSLYARKKTPDKLDIVCDSCNLFEIHSSKRKSAKNP
jgi:MoaA/NifB/PqqE/SkfB family radical SAM enzyme